MADPDVLAEMSKGRLRRKKEQLVAALEGRFRPHHARLRARILAHIDFLDDSINECEAEIEALCRPFVPVIERLDEISGVNARSAQDLIAEIWI